MKTKREIAADDFVEKSEYDSEVSREMFLSGWDACARETEINFERMTEITKNSIQLSSELYKFVTDFIVKNQGDKKNGKVHNQHR